MDKNPGIIYDKQNSYYKKIIKSEISRNIDPLSLIAKIKWTEFFFNPFNNNVLENFYFREFRTYVILMAPMRIWNFEKRENREMTDF